MRPAELEKKGKNEICRGNHLSFCKTRGGDRGREVAQRGLGLGLSRESARKDDKNWREPCGDDKGEGRSEKGRNERCRTKKRPRHGDTSAGNGVQRKEVDERHRLNKVDPLDGAWGGLNIFKDGTWGGNTYFLA